jgi:hypothetical protein
VDEEWNGRDDRKFSRENTDHFRKAKKKVREGETGKNYESGRMRRYAERLSDGSQKKQELTET